MRVKVCISTKNEAGKISHRSTPSPKKAKSNPIFEDSVTAGYEMNCLFSIQFLRHKPALLTIHRFFFFFSFPGHKYTFGQKVEDLCYPIDDLLAV